MKEFYNYIKDYFQEKFSLKIHIVIGLFLGSAIFINYYFDFYTWLLSKQGMERLLTFFAFFGFAFGFVLFSVSYLDKNSRFLYPKKYILFAVLGLFLIALDTSYFLKKIYSLVLSEEQTCYRFLINALSNLLSFFAIVLPLFLIYFFTPYFVPELYGLRLNGAKLRPYLILILFIIPIVYAATFSKDFLETYPMFFNSAFRECELSFLLKTFIYEMCYGFDFFSTELMFRGFFVVALSRFVGKEAVLPMVAVYTFLHFGKPLGEAVASIFGGYILGILAYQSRNIYGGLVLHLGIAWGMELAAYLTR